MSEDLEITFGKTVLIEKCPNDIISLGINHFCRENVPQSNLHCLVSAKGWLVVIRHMDGVAMCGPDYSCFRIIMLRKIADFNLSKEDINYLIVNKFMWINYASGFSYNAIESGIQRLDTGVIICHKHSLVHLLKDNIIELIKESKNIRLHNEIYHGYYEFGFQKEINFTHKGLPPCIKASVDNNCSILYGGDKKIKKTFLNLKNAQSLKVKVKFWLKTENKSAYEKGKSITVKPV